MEDKVNLIFIIISLNDNYIYLFFLNNSIE